MGDADRAVVMMLQDNAALIGKCERLQAENTKLRELVRDMHRAICGLVVLGDDYAGEYEDNLYELDDRMQEFGIEP